MISVESLTKHYGRFTAVDHVSFTAAPGRVTGFLGPNGAGKSTTMRVMVGLTRPTTGRVTIGGRDYRELPNPGLEVGVLLDASAQHAGRTGREILTIAQQTMGLPRPGSRRPSPGSASPRTRPSAASATTPSACASASASPPRSSATPRCSSSTSPPTASTRPASAGCATCCAASPTTAAPCCCPRTCSTRSRSSPTTSSSSARAASWPRAPRPSCSPQPARSCAPPTPTVLARALHEAAVVTTPIDGGLRVDADPELVGETAHRAGVVLRELRAADGAGLEEMFLELTAETAREGAAA